MAGLPHVDPSAANGPLHRALVWLLSSSAMTRLSATALWGRVTWSVDRYLLRVTHGRLGLGLVLPTALLETVGARTGQRRRTAVIYFHDGERVTIIASHAGRPGNPSWFYNARSNPDVVLGGLPFRAEVIEDEARRAELFELADRVFPAFATYRETATRAGRTIPILQLVPR